MIRTTLLLVILAAAATAAEPIPRPVDWTVAAHRGGGGRVLFAPEPPLLNLANDPAWAPSFETRVAASEKGEVAHAHLRNGWAHCAYESPDDRTVLVEGRGFYFLVVNGEKVPGDFYRTGWLRWPIRLRKGTNHLIARAIRGGFSIRLLPAEGPASLGPKDPTLPDLREGTLVEAPGAVVVANHGTEPLEGAVLEVGDGEVFEKIAVKVDPILPCATAKPPFTLRQLRAPEEGERDEKGRYPLPVTLRVGETEVSSTYRLAIRKVGDAYRETRISGIDGSVQEHAVRAPVRVEEGKRYALFLSLHGAGVPCINQARAYAAKEDAFVVAPTNRRPYGFDWQDWGRLDALECLDRILERYPIDPDRVYLTGHSMGGHGTWYLGCVYPDRFAAIAPSAGWASFFTYGGGVPRDHGDSPALDTFERQQVENDTEALVRNLEWTPVYVLHGEKDDNVPVAQARRMIGHLAGFHRSFVYHEEPGAKHWWGNRCVDWPPLIEFCRRQVRSPRPLRVRFATFDPQVSSRRSWVVIRALERRGEVGSVEVVADPETRAFRVKTENVADLVLDIPALFEDGKGGSVAIDDTRSESASVGPIRYTKRDGQWYASPTPEHLGPPVAGSFKLAWQNRMVWVYGTQGTPEENAAILAKVRYDAGVWWYRGNGHVTVVPDTGYDATRFAGRNVILYGNATTNGAFSVLPDTCPIRIERGTLRLGDDVREGDLGAYYAFAGPGGTRIGVVGATTARAMRMTQQARWFISGSAVPDWVVFDEAVLREGLAGVRDAGFFTPEGRIEKE